MKERYEIQIDINNETSFHTLAEAENMLNKAVIARQEQRTIELATQIIQQKPQSLVSYYALYQVYTFQQSYKKLRLIAHSALSTNPNDSKSHHILANAYRFLRQADKAILAMEKAVKLEPQNINWQNALGIMYKDAGKFTSAVKCFNTCISLKPNDAAAYWHRAELQEYLSAKELISLSDILSKTEQTNSKNQVYSAYTLFKHYDKSAQYQLAFDFLELGAKLQRKILTYHHQSEIDEHKSIAQSYNESLLSKESDFAIDKVINAANSSDSPIFICGLPRSGSTLAEQVISAHPRVVGGDELFELAQATQDILRKIKPNQNFPYWATELTQSHWQEIGEQYLSLTTHINSQDYFTDKMPLNYKAIGLIAKALPNAKIIYCQRAPMDLLLGCYKQLLDQGNKFTYDLNELSDIIIAHHTLMQHWLNVLPTKIFTLSYEQLVTNQHNTTSQMLSFLNLNWHEDCLDFHKNPRAVHTVSNVQIRQPLFSSSINAWRKYYKQLLPYAHKLRDAGINVNL